MTSTLTRNIAIAASALGGILAGANLDRSIVQMPAWQHIGTNAWAQYSRKADMGNGVFFYPTIAIGSAILAIAAAVSGHTSHTMPRSTRIPLDIAAALGIGGLLATTRAAPHMLSLRRIDDDPAALQQAHDKFLYWGSIRSALQVLAFVAQLWALLRMIQGVDH